MRGVQTASIWSRRTLLGAIGKLTLPGRGSSQVAEQREILGSAVELVGLEQQAHFDGDGAEHFQPLAFAAIPNGIERLLSRRKQIPMQHSQIVRTPCFQDGGGLSASVGELSVDHRISSKFLSASIK